MSNVAGTTVTNISGNSRKFYRVFVIDCMEVRQWGRIGTTGQFKFIDHPGKRAAEDSAADQIRAKQNKGYSGTTSLTFGFDTKTFDRLYQQNPQQAAQAIAAAYEAAEMRSMAATPMAPASWELTNVDDELTPPPASHDLEAFAERALNVVTAAATGDEQAGVGYARLREEFTEVQEQFERCETLLETIETMLTGVRVSA